MTYLARRVLTFTSLVTLLFLGCSPERQPVEQVGRQSLPLDDVGVAPENMSLLLLTKGAERRDAERTIRALGGTLFHAFPPRLLVAQVPRGATAVLADSGVSATFARSVDPDELADLSLAERRFVRVFTNRYYPETTPPRLLVPMTQDGVHESESFESAPQELTARADLNTRAAEDAEARVFVPYAAGTVVVSVWLPESNGSEEPSTEDWTETSVLEAYSKVQAALEVISRSEPLANLRFVLHYESAPAEGGLEGTIDLDYEFGKHSGFGVSDENRMVALMLSRILQREVPEYETFDAQLEYLSGLRERYQADGAFSITVGANQNFTAGYRAQAYFNGPRTTVPSTNSISVFAHEFGHIFGAADEYCPDACISPSSLYGYSGMINANATFRRGPGGGIADGQGENQSSLMLNNDIYGINGYTRGAWGWLDTDGDGVLEVLDTTPVSDLEFSFEADELLIEGTVTDAPATPLFATPFSVNRITELEYRFEDLPNSPWLTIRLPQDTRGRQVVGESFGLLPAGAHRVSFRAVNSVGNRELQPRTLSVQSDQRGNAPPRVRLQTSRVVGSPSTAFELSAAALDLDGEIASIDFDTTGDGNFDRASRPGETVTASSLAPGRVTLAVRVRDDAGAEAVDWTEVLVTDKNSSPVVEIAGSASPRFGQSELRPTFSVKNATDGEAGPLEFNWRAETIAVPDDPVIETGFDSRNLEFRPVLRAPEGLVTEDVDIAAGDAELASASVLQILPLDAQHWAVAGSGLGVWIVNVADRGKPVIVSRLALETRARRLFKNGNRLYVLGGQLAVVDVSDLAQPRELKQWWRTRHTRRLTETREVPISGKEALVSLEADFDERIRSLHVRLELSHPSPEGLTIELWPPKGSGLRSIVLQQADEPEEPGPKPEPLPEVLELRSKPKPSRARRVFRFTEKNVPELAQLNAQFSGGPWTIRVADGAGELNAGVLHSSQLQFQTEHRALPLTYGTEDIAGTVGDDTVVLTGRGFEVIHVGLPGFSFPVSRKRGTEVNSAVLRGDRLLVASRLSDEEKERDFAGSGASPLRYRGLYGVDLSKPYRPRLIRRETVSAAELSAIDDRFYYLPLPESKPEGPGPPEPEPLPRGAAADRDVPAPPAPVVQTLVGDFGEFFNGGNFVIGGYEGIISRFASGDNERLYNVGRGSQLELLDVSDPQQITVLERFAEPAVYSPAWLSATELIAGFGTTVQWIDLSKRRNTISRLFRITLEARDAAGNVGSVTRTVHLVPYNHRPTGTTAEHVSGVHAGQTWEFAVDTNDSDSRPSWDPQLLARADLDGDGKYDFNWQFMGSPGGARFFVDFPGPGTYTLKFEARDGFYATDETSITVDVEEPRPVECTPGGRECSRDEFCQFDLSASCGESGTGICTEYAESCDGEPEEAVCGCDRRNYASPCDAARSGVSVAALGPCPEIVCGGAAGDTCGETEYCQFPADDACGDDGSSGVCAPRPPICLFPPPGNEVCGCDQRTYPSACAAASSGTNVQSAGICADDCRVSGCAKGEVCQSCFAGYACLPEGASC